MPLIKPQGHFCWLFTSSDRITSFWGLSNLLRLLYHGSMKDDGKGPNKRAGEKGPHKGTSLGLPFSDERKEEYCNELAKHGLRQKAARAIGVHPDTVSKHLGNDPNFKALYQAALEDYRESIQSEMHRRAVVGTEKPLYFQGKRVVETDPVTKKQVRVSVKEYDTQLLIMLAKRWIKEFREKHVVENHNVNLDMGLAEIDDMSPEQLAQLKKLIEMEGDG